MIKVDLENQELVGVNSQVEKVEFDGDLTVNVVRNHEDDLTAETIVELVDEPTYAKLPDMNFKNGEISVKVYSQLLPKAPEYARGFIGLAFRINEDDTQFESFYIRPTNGRTDDPIRKLHAVQYFSYPDYKFHILRESHPNLYEAPADIGLNEWIDLKLIVEGEKASIYINHSDEPALVVNDLKHDVSSGSIALWSEVGTDGYFKDLTITEHQ